MTKRVLILLIFGFSFSCSSQNRDSLEAFSYGKIENAKYFNSFFKFKMDLPADWEILTGHQIDNLNSQGMELLSKEDNKIAKTINPSSISTANLVGAFQYKLGAVVDFNPGFSITVENVAHITEIKSAKDVLLKLRSILERSEVQFDSIDSDFAKRNVNGEDFYTMTSSKDIGYLNIRQTNYVTIKKGFAFVLTISYAKDSQRIILERAIESMAFN